MKPKLNKNLSLPWTPQGEKASGNEFPHLPNNLTFWLCLPGCLVSIVDLADRAVVLIHDHSHKYLYQLAPTYEQKPILGKKQYLRTSQKVVPGSPFTGQNVRLASPPLPKNLPHSWTISGNLC